MKWMSFAAVVGCAVSMLSHVLLVRTLRTWHPQAWYESGAPTLINRSIERSRMFAKWNARGAYRELGDPQLVFYAVVWKVSTIATAGLFIAMALYSLIAGI